MVSGNGRDPAISHQCFPRDGKRDLKTAALPADKQPGKQADVCGQHPAICTHPFDPATIAAKIAFKICGYHKAPPSNSLFMSASL